MEAPLYPWLETGRVASHGRIASKVLKRYLSIAPELFSVDDPPGFERRRKPPDGLRTSADLWQCPECKRRVKLRNAERHQRAEECVFSVEWYSRNLAGWRDLNLSYLSLCTRALVPMWLGPSHLSAAKTHFDAKMVCGVWVPKWATEAIHLCRRTECSTLERLTVMRLVRDDRTYLDAIEAAMRLSDWGAVRLLLAEQVRAQRSEKTQQVQTGTTARNVNLRSFCS